MLSLGISAASLALTSQRYLNQLLGPEKPASNTELYKAPAAAVPIVTVPASPRPFVWTGTYEGVVDFRDFLWHERETIRLVDPASGTVLVLPLAKGFSFRPEQGAYQSRDVGPQPVVLTVQDNIVVKVVVKPIPKKEVKP